MEITVKELDYCKLQINYQTGAEDILNKRGEVLNAFKKAPVKGYRPGKGSMEAIKIQYKDQIEDALKRAMIEDAYHNTLFEKKFRPHGAPKFNSASLQNGSFACEFEMFVKPEFTLANFKDVELPKPPAQISSEEMCQKILQDLRIKLGEISPYSETDFVQIGDNVILDYIGYVDGEKVEALSATGEMLTVGSSPVQNFDQNLLGMTIGEVRKFHLPIPDTALPSYAGKEATFEVSIITGSKTNPMPLDQTLAEKLGKASFEDLRTEVMGTAMAQVERANKLALTNAVSAKLVEDNAFQVPHWLTLSEAQYLAQKSNTNWETLSDFDKEKYLQTSEKNVRLALILDKIREDEPEAQLSDQEVFDMIKQNLAQTKVDKSIDEVIQEMNKTGYMQILFSRIRDEYALDFIVKNTKFVE